MYDKNQIIINLSDMRERLAGAGRWREPEQNFMLDVLQNLGIDDDGEVARVMRGFSPDLSFLFGNDDDYQEVFFYE